MQTPNQTPAAKERFAKLMATENLTIEHDPKMTTAAFDVENRTLILPVWDGMSQDLYDLFISHEVFHALHTPADSFHDKLMGSAAFRGFVNVTEDCRIEKKGKRKFPGLRGAMERGYAELVDRGFFGPDLREKVNGYSLIDRINVKAKLGSAIDIHFDEEEFEYYKRAMSTETFAAALQLTKELFKREKDKGNEAKSDTDQTPQFAPADPGDENAIPKDELPEDAEIVDQPKSEKSDEGDDAEADEGEGESGSGDSDDDSEEGEGDSSSDSGEASDEDSDDDSPDSSGKGDSDEDAEDGDSDEADTDGSGDAKGDDSDEDADGEAEGDSDSDETGSAPDGDSELETDATDGEVDVEPRSITDDFFREKEESLANTSAKQPVYSQIPADDTWNLDALILPAKFVHAAIAKKNAPQADQIRARFKEFRADANKTVNYLVKEFEMKKAAQASARAYVSATGVVDTNKLHSYKWNENIFRKATNVPEGKNHGLVMFVDWSGSMDTNMAKTIEQVMLLVMFCQKVSIPFDVYAFTTQANARNVAKEAPAGLDKLNVDGELLDPKKVQKGDILPISGWSNNSFRLFQLATSRASRMETNATMHGLMAIRDYFHATDGRYNYTPDRMQSYVSLPLFVELGSTPLNQTVMAAIPIVNQFRAMHRVEIVNTIFLTDGAGGECSKLHGVDTNIAYRSNVILRDRKLPNGVGENSRRRRMRGQFSAFLDIFRARTGTKIVNFYVTGKESAVSNFQRISSEYSSGRGRKSTKGFSDEGLAAMEDFKKLGGCIVPNAYAGYDQEYLLSGDLEAAGASKVGIEVDTTKKNSARAIGKAFTKSRTSGIRARKVLGEFVTLIAE